MTTPWPGCDAARGWSPGEWPRSATPRVPIGSRTRSTGGVRPSAAAVVRDEVMVPGTGLVSMGSSASPTFRRQRARGSSRRSSAPAATAPGSPSSGTTTWLRFRELVVQDGDPSAPQRHLRRRRHERSRVESVVAEAVAGSRRASWRRSCSRGTWSPPPTPPSTCGGRCAARRRLRMCWTFHVDGLFGATPRAAGAPRARPGHLARAGRHDPAHRRRRPRPRPGRPRWPARRRTSRSTSTPSARSPSRSRRTARR